MRNLIKDYVKQTAITAAFSIRKARSVRRVLREIADKHIREVDGSIPDNDLMSTFEMDWYCSIQNLYNFEFPSLSAGDAVEFIKYTEMSRKRPFGSPKSARHLELLADPMIAVFLDVVERFRFQFVDSQGTLDDTTKHSRVKAAISKAIETSLG